MDEAPRPRQTVSLTHKQLGVGGGILAAVAMVSQLKGMFVPVEKSQFQDQQIAQVQQQLSALRDDFGHKFERGNDKIIERIDRLEERITKSQDKLEARVNSLEAAHMGITKAKTN